MNLSITKEMDYSGDWVWVICRDEKYFAETRSEAEANEIVQALSGTDPASEFKPCSN